MSKLTNGGGKSFIDWWKNPRNRKKVYDSDRKDAEELKKMTENEQQRNDHTTTEP